MYPSEREESRAMAFSRDSMAGSYLFDWRYARPR
jgi:hypothetical protein